MELNIEQFNPKVAELEALAASSQALTITDFGDQAQIEAIKTKRKELVKTRGLIEDTGKAMRADALKFQKEVIARENTLVAIIQPEELRLKALEEEAKNYQVRQERLRKQPERLEKLKATGEWQPIPGMEETLLELDDVEFEGLLAKLNTAHSQKILAQKEAEQAAKQAELDARQAEIERKENEQKTKEAAELAEKQRAADIEAARIEGERKAKEDAAKAEAEEKARLARLEKTKKYKEFLEKHGYNEKTKDKFKVFETDRGYTLYKVVGEFLK